MNPEARNLETAEALLRRLRDMEGLVDDAESHQWWEDMTAYLARPAAPRTYAEADKLLAQLVKDCEGYVYSAVIDAARDYLARPAAPAAPADNEAHNLLVRVWNSKWVALPPPLKEHIAAYLDGKPAPAQTGLREALEAARRELDNIRESRCTCTHDYYHGDHHYKFCPASTESKAAARHLKFLLNRVAYELNRPIRAALADEHGVAPPQRPTTNERFHLVEWNGEYTLRNNWRPMATFKSSDNPAQAKSDAEFVLDALNTLPALAPQEGAQDQ